MDAFDSSTQRKERPMASATPLDLLRATASAHLRASHRTPGTALPEGLSRLLWSWTLIYLPTVERSGYSQSWRASCTTPPCATTCCPGSAA